MLGIKLNFKFFALENEYCTESRRHEGIHAELHQESQKNRFFAGQTFAVTISLARKVCGQSRYLQAKIDSENRTNYRAGISNPTNQEKVIRFLSS